MTKFCHSLVYGFLVPAESPVNVRAGFCYQVLVFEWDGPSDCRILRETFLNENKISVLNQPAGHLVKPEKMKNNVPTLRRLIFTAPVQSVTIGKDGAATQSSATLVT